MGRSPCCSKIGLHKGPWTPTEDKLLTNYIHSHGEGRWRSLAKKAGILRCGKSCRLRWLNYLRPGIKRGDITPGEDDIIIRMHSLLGNRWYLIAGRLPGRTDNEIKNYWNTHLSKKLKIIQGINDIQTNPKKLPLLENINPKINIHCCKKINDSGENVGIFKPKAIRVTSPLTHLFVESKDVNSKSTFDDSPVYMNGDEGLSFIINCLHLRREVSKKFLKSICNCWSQMGRLLIRLIIS